MAVLANTPIPTANGWKLASELSTNDIVFNPEGQPQPVLTIQSWIPAACYEVHFDDGLSITGDGHMGFQCQTKNWREHYCRWLRRKNRVRNRKFWYRLTHKTAKDLCGIDLKNRIGGYEYSIGNTKPVQYPRLDLPVPPYVYGLWVGSRSQVGNHWVQKGMDVNKLRAKLRNYGFTVVKKKYKKEMYKMEFRPSIPHAFASMRAVVPFEMPFYYIMGSADQREELLQGLIDAHDAKKTKIKSKYVINDPSWPSIRKKQGLLESLGVKTTLLTPSKSLSYQLFFHWKSDNHTYTRRFITKVTKIEPKQCVHIVTEAPFLAAEGYLAVC